MLVVLLLVGGVEEDVETILVADDAEAVAQPIAAAFGWLLHAGDVVLRLVVLPGVFVVLPRIVGVAKQPVVLHIYGVVPRLVELAVPPFDVDVLLLPHDDDVLLPHAVCAHLQQLVDEPPLRVVSNDLLQQLYGEPHPLPPVAVSFLPA